MDRRPVRIGLLAALGILLGGVGSPPAEATDLGDGRVRLRNEEWDARTGPAPTEAAALPAALVDDEIGAWIVAFQGPADRWMRGALESAGARIAGYVPSNAYLVRATERIAVRLPSVDGVLRVERFRPAWKLSAGIEPAGPGDPPLRITLLLFDDADAARVSERVTATGAEIVDVRVSPLARRIRVHANRDRLMPLARIPGVEWIEETLTPEPRNDVVRWVIQSNETGSVPLYDEGLFGEGEILGHIDGPVSTLSCFFLDPDETPIGPDHRKLVAARRSSGTHFDWHGTHTAGILAGDQEPVNGFPDTRGMAPDARISHASWEDLNGEYNSLPSNLADMLLDSHADGARIHSNSWGDDDRTSYTSWCLDIDTFMREYEDDLVVFAVTNGASLKTPENAKSVLSVGATSAAPAQHLHRIGGRGPTVDGRRKPDVLAPGDMTRSAAASPCATSAYLGTSMACPAVAGGAALVREYFRRGFHPGGAPREAFALVPTGALLKAVVINSAVDMTGVPGYPSALEGWGRILLDDALYFQGDSRRLWTRDVRHADGMETGDTVAWDLHVLSASEPLKFTLAYTDQPGTASASLWMVNDLDLEVVAPDGTLYRGNVIDPLVGQSGAGGTADNRDPVERVIRSVPEVGIWTVRVRATSVPDGPQGFAIAANGTIAMPRSPWKAPAPEERGVDGHPDEGSAVRLGPYTPNPFAGSAVVPYSLPAEARVVIRVYDVRGELVRVLLDRTVGRGDHLAHWDGRDESGAPVAPGIYLTRLEAGGVVKTVKGVLLR